MSHSYRNQLVCRTNQVTGSYLCGSMLLNELLFFPSPNMIKNLRPKCFHITLQSLSKCRDNHLQGVCQHICLCSFYLLYYSLIEGKTQALSQQCKIDHIDFRDWMAFLQSNLTYKISPNQEAFKANTFMPFISMEKLKRQ